MENYTYNSFTLQLEGLKVTTDYTYSAFCLLFIFYILIMFLNIGISLLIFIDKNLHQPMYLFFCSLSVSDLIGSTNILPRLLADILRPPSERLITYYECVVQAFMHQFFSTTAHTVLIIMAYDRYVAICNPLHYASIMTNKMVMKLTVCAWGVAFVMVWVLIGLSVRLNRCRTLITNPYCDNASLFKLSCEDVSINNIYGLMSTVIVLTASIGTTVLTYSRITVVCLISKNQTLNSKALKTCCTHLVVYLIMLITGFTVIILHRFPDYSDQRKLFALLFVIIPGTFNPIIYGVQSKEIRKLLWTTFKPKRFLTCQKLPLKS